MATSPRLLTKFTNIFSRKDEPMMMTMNPHDTHNDGDDENSTVDNATMRDSVISQVSSVHTQQHPTTPPPLRTIQLDQSFSERDKLAVDQAFDKLMREYALSSTIRPNLTQLSTKQKSIMLMQSSKKKNHDFFNNSYTYSSNTIRTTQNRLSVANNSNHNNNDNNTTHDQNNVSNTPSSNNNNYTPTSHRESSPSPATTSRSSNLLLSFKPSTYGKRKSVKDMFKTDSPEYYCRALRSSPTDDDLVHLKIHLRSSVVSWTDEFLALGGFEALTYALGEFKKDIKKQSDKKIELLCRCFKTIMSPESKAVEKVLTQPEALEHVRDILFGPSDIKFKSLYLLNVQTRYQLVDLLCTLPSIQVTTDDGDYIHGYDILRRLLCDKPEDVVAEEPKRQTPGFPTSFKADTETMMKKMSDGAVSRPRYTAWMRELQLTVERHIEPMNYLSQVLGYDFESAKRQQRVHQRQQYEMETGLPLPSTDSEQASGETRQVVMVDEGVVDYIIIHLRLVCTLVTKPATTFTGDHDKYEQEKMRMEIMLSGFKKVTDILLMCPHPTLPSAYIRYLEPLIRPWADLFEDEFMEDDGDSMWDDIYD
ncbi:armadillo-type protein [Phascolomyces articulosus]|uniref:Armadillo-type protein n=1 Tax=Phascolomyces articulosus TaxID=60185 RepID=A0AAD5K0Z1_9FUNG|nr:armadillo-type protein [Phascolomyces articulosus]